MPGGAPAGNVNARKGRRWADALQKALVRFQDPAQRIAAGQALDRIAEKVVLMALAGDKDAISEIGNRLDGKPGQTIDANIDAGGGLLAVLAGIGKSDDPSVA